MLNQKKLLYVLDENEDYPELLFRNHFEQNLELQATAADPLFLREAKKIREEMFVAYGNQGSVNHL